MDSVSGTNGKLGGVFLADHWNSGGHTLWKGELCKKRVAKKWLNHHLLGVSFIFVSALWSDANNLCSIFLKLDNSNKRHVFHNPTNPKITTVDIVMYSFRFFPMNIRSSQKWEDYNILYKPAFPSHLSWTLTLHSVNTGWANTHTWARASAFKDVLRKRWTMSPLCPINSTSREFVLQK